MAALFSPDLELQSTEVVEYWEIVSSEGRILTGNMRAGGAVWTPSRIY